MSEDKEQLELSEAEAPKEPPKLEEPKSKLSRFLSHPAAVVIVFFSAIASLIALPLSFYFYYAAKEYPQLTFYVHPVKATIVRTGESSRLTAVIDNKPVETDITAAQLAIWNQGRRPIKKDQVLKPIVIFTENNAPIIEATIRKSSREVTQLALNTDELQKGRVTIQWDILERNDGGVIQLIYAGNPDVRIQAEGIIEGQSQIERLEFTGNIKSPYEQYESGRWEYRYWGYISILLGMSLILGARSIRKRKANYRSELNDYIKALKESIDFYEDRIAYETKSITTGDKYIADVERQIKEIEDEITEFKKEGFESAEMLETLKESQLQRITAYRKEQQASREQITEYESKREKIVADEAEVRRDYQRQERRFNMTALALVILGTLAFIPAIYLLLIAQPAGPPFGF